MKLYDLADDYRAVQDLFEAGDIDEQTMVDTLESIEGTINQKAENIILMTRNMQGDQDAIKKEIDRLKAKEKAIDNKIKNIKGYLLAQMLKNRFKENKHNSCQHYPCQRQGILYGEH